MSTMLCGDEVHIASRNREYIRDSILNTIRKYRRPVRPIEISHDCGINTTAIGQAMSYFEPMTFRRVLCFSDKVSNKKSQCAFYIALHPDLARFESEYHPFGHLFIERES